MVHCLVNNLGPTFVPFFTIHVLSALKFRFLWDRTLANFEVFLELSAQLVFALWTLDDSQERLHVEGFLDQVVESKTLHESATHLDEAF